MRSLRELSLLTHKENLALSVDNYVPETYSEHYRRDVQAEYADYVLIMSYDENTSQVGPNSSIEFVTKGINKTLEDVPASRVINIIPFLQVIRKGFRVFLHKCFPEPTILHFGATAAVNTMRDQHIRDKRVLLMQRDFKIFG